MTAVLGFLPDRSEKRAETGPACDCGERFCSAVLGVLDDAFEGAEPDGGSEDDAPGGSAKQEDS